MDIPKHIKEDFSREPLLPETLADDPMAQFHAWFMEACEKDPDAPNAVSLASASKDGIPGVRTVLMKFYDERGFVFFTNYGSRKGQNLESNPLAAMLFPWARQSRQVIARGPVLQLPHEESYEYFKTRSRGSRIGAWASRQSAIIPDRSVLEQRLTELTERFAEGDVPLPDFWGGYRLIPDTVEFWQGQADRLHDRFEYSRTSQDGWIINRLSP